MSERRFITNEACPKSIDENGTICGEPSNIIEQRTDPNSGLINAVTVFILALIQDLGCVGVLARLAAIKAATIGELKKQWRDLFGSEPPPFNRRYLESRLAYRVQELAYGGLKPDTVKRLEDLGEQLDGGNIGLRSVRADLKPIAGTRLIREWQHHCCGQGILSDHQVMRDYCQSIGHPEPYPDGSPESVWLYGVTFNIDTQLIEVVKAYERTSATA